MVRSKGLELPPEAELQPDGRYFVPFKPRSQPKPAPVSSNPGFTPLSDFYELDESPKEAPDPVPLFRPIQGNKGNPQAMPMKDAPPIQYVQ